MDKNVRDLFVACLIVLIIAFVALQPASQAIQVHGETTRIELHKMQALVVDPAPACAQTYVPNNGFGHPACIRPTRADVGKHTYAWGIKSVRTVTTTIVVTPTPIVVVVDTPVVVIDTPVIDTTDDGSCKNKNQLKEGTSDCNAGRGNDK